MSWDFLSWIDFILLTCVCACVCVTMCRYVHMRTGVPIRNVTSLRSQGPGDHRSPVWVLGTAPDPLQEQCMFLTTEPSPQPRSFLWEAWLLKPTHRILQEEKVSSPLRNLSFLHCGVLASLVTEGCSDVTLRNNSGCDSKRHTEDGVAQIPHPCFPLQGWQATRRPVAWAWDTAAKSTFSESS